MQTTITKQIYNITLLCLLAWIVPQQSVAQNVEDTYRYQAMLNGSNSVSIKVPVYDEDGADHWVSNGNLKVTWKDDQDKEHTETLFWWRKDENGHDNDESDLWCKFKTTASGSIEVTQGNSGKHFTLTSADGDCCRSPRQQLRQRPLPAGWQRLCL